MRNGWEELRLGDVVSQVLDFRGRTPLKLGMAWGGGTIPALSAVNVRDGRLDLTRTAHFGSDALYERWMTQGDAERGGRPDHDRSAARQYRSDSGRWALHSESACNLIKAPQGASRCRLLGAPNAGALLPVAA